MAEKKKTSSVKKSAAPKKAPAKKAAAKPVAKVKEKAQPKAASAKKKTEVEKKKAAPKAKVAPKAKAPAKKVAAKPVAKAKEKKVVKAPPKKVVAKGKVSAKKEVSSKTKPAKPQKAAPAKKAAPKKAVVPKKASSKKEVVKPVKKNPSKAGSVKKKSVEVASKGKTAKPVKAVKPVKVSKATKQTKEVKTTKSVETAKSKETKSKEKKEPVVKVKKGKESAVDIDKKKKVTKTSGKPKVQDSSKNETDEVVVKNPVENGSKGGKRNLKPRVSEEPVVEPLYPVLLKGGVKLLKTPFFEDSPEAEEKIKKGRRQGSDLEKPTVALRHKASLAEETPEELHERVLRELEEENKAFYQEIANQICTRCCINVVSPEFRVDKDMGYCEECASILKLGMSKEARQTEYSLNFAREEDDQDEEFVSGPNDDDLQESEEDFDDV